MTASDLLSWIRTRAISGQLSVRRDSLLRTLETDGTSITWVSSNRPSDALSQVLRARGIIDDSGLERAAVIEAKSGVLLGQALVDAKVLQPSQVLTVLDSQIREAAMDILSWNRGTFRFVPENTDQRSRLAVAIAIEELERTGHRLAKPWARLRDAATTPNAQFVVCTGVSGRSKFPDSPPVRRRHDWLLGRIERGATFDELLATARAERFTTTADLAVLLDRELIEIGPTLPEARRGNLSPTTSAPEVLALLADGKHLEALSLARRAVAEGPATEELATLLEKTERGVIAHLSRTLLDSYRVPRRVVSDEELETSALTEDQRYAIGRIDGVWDLFSLVTSSALGELTSLVTYKELDERGLIEL